MSPRRSARAIWLRWLLAALALYAAATAVAWVSSDGMLYQWRYGSFRAPDGGERIATPAGPELSVLYLPNLSARYTLWYFHGNAEDLGDIGPRLHALRNLGYAVFACDYPGYGLSGGHPSEPSINAATRTALAYLQAKHGVRPEQIVVYGRSMGGGPAVELATTEPVAGLILESAFLSVYRVMTHWPILPFDKFENLRKIPRVRCPVLMLHGRDDRVVPFYHGETLFAAIRAPKRHFWSETAGHNDLEATEGAAFWGALWEFTADLGVQPTSKGPST